MKKTTIAVILIAVCLLTSAGTPFSNRVNLHGGVTSTKSLGIWQLYRFRDKGLMRKYPLCWCPWQAHVAVRNNVTIEVRNNKNCFCVNADLYNMLKSEAEWNRAHAKVYKGSDLRKVKKIYDYCRKTNYEIHKKTARDVFENRSADCAGISEAFYVMCKKNKIPVRYCIGWCDEGCHAWNRVKIGKKWYWIDATMERWLWRPLYDGYSLMAYW